MEMCIQVDVSCQVQRIIQEARDPHNLSQMYFGWQSYLWFIFYILNTMLFHYENWYVKRNRFLNKYFHTILFSFSCTFLPLYFFQNNLCFLNIFLMQYFLNAQKKFLIRISRSCYQRWRWCFVVKEHACAT